MRWLKASKGYILKKEVLWWHLIGFLGVRASSLWITAPLEALISAEPEMALPFYVVNGYDATGI